jgi:hypothetical protein
MSVWEQVDLDYARARRRAFLAGLWAWVGRRCASLCAFDEARGKSGAENRRYVGMRTVEVSRDLPPVVLYKSGDDYYVHDGNHRVSVARFEGVEMIDAEVTEFFPARRVGPSGAAA